MQEKINPTNQEKEKCVEYVDGNYSKDNDSSRVEAEKNKSTDRDFIFDYYKRFEDKIDNEDYRRELWNNWKENFIASPDKFFSEKNFKHLSTLKPEDRLAQFFFSTRSLHVTPSLARKYFEKFPDDLEAAIILFRDHSGMPNTTNELEFFGTVAPMMYEHDKGLDKIKMAQDNQFLAIAERKDLAPQLLMGDGSYEGLPLAELFGKFGDGAKGLIDAIEEARDLQVHGNHFIDPEQIYTKEFKELNEQDKAKLLRMAISVLHNDLIFEEVWNSGFTRELMDRISSLGKHHFTEAHSYLFKTYQPISAFDTDQSWYDFVMNKAPSMRGGAVEEYAFSRLLLSCINSLGKSKVDKEKNVDFLVEFWDKNRNPIFANEVTDAFSRQDATRAASRLITRMKNEKDDKRALASILYRLELGQINISREGALYLEKMYDLGLYNNPDYHVSRLTPGGEVGIFNEEKELIKYFELGDLTAGDKKIKARVLDITYDTLFIPKKDESKDERERRLKYLEEFKKKYYQTANDKIFRETDVRLNNLTFKEQGWYIINLQKSAPEEKNKLINFTKQYQENGIKAFLSMNQGEEMGDKILTIGEKFKNKGADLIFRKYNAIASYIDSLAENIRENFSGQRDYEEREIRGITNNLLAKARQVLVKYSEQAERGDELSYEKISQELREVSEQVILFASVFKIAAQDRALSLEDFKGVELRAVDSSELSEQDREEMARIYQANRPDYPERLLKVFPNELREQRGQTRETFYTLKVDDKLVSFIRYKDLPNGNVYAGSFNVRPEAKSSAIGDALLKTTLEQEGKDKVIEGVVYSKHPKFDDYIKYLEKLGFKIVGEIENYEGTGEKFYKIERQPSAEAKRSAA